jgi:glycosyltransferase involved in cell wall biosynthesis
VSDPADPAAQPPDDALLWRVQGQHHEVVCYVVAADTGVVLCVASDGENDLLVAESHTTLADAMERGVSLPRELGGSRADAGERQRLAGC